MNYSIKPITPFELYSMYLMRKKGTILKKVPKKYSDILDKLSIKTITSMRYINMDKYFDVCFEVYPGFTLERFGDEKIFERYILHDKSIKMKTEFSKESFVKSFKFIKGLAREFEITENVLQWYCNLFDGNERVVDVHYMRNNIDTNCVFYLAVRGCFTPRDMIRYGYIQRNQDVLTENVLKNSTFIKKAETYL
jgi:hypothetical protein